MPFSFVISVISVVSVKQEMCQYWIANTSFTVQSAEDKTVDLDIPNKYFSPGIILCLVSITNSGHFSTLFSFSSVLVTYPNFLFALS